MYFFHAQLGWYTWLHMVNFYIVGFELNLYKSCVNDLSLAIK